jgi:two-component system LytT family response regulator
MEGFDVVRMSEVVYCEAHDNFTCFYFKEGGKSMICRNLKFYEKMLKDFGFCRIHRSTIINVEYVKRYIKGKGGSVIMENGTELIVSNSKKTHLLEMIKG